MRGAGLQTADRVPRRGAGLHAPARAAGPARPRPGLRRGGGASRRSGGRRRPGPLVLRDDRADVASSDPTNLETTHRGAPVHADSAIDLYASRLMVPHAAWKVEHCLPHRQEVAMTKTFVSKQKSMSGSQILVLGVAYKTGHRRRARVAGAEADRAPAKRGRKRRLPRPACSSVPDFSRLESVPLDPAPYDCVDDRDRPPSIDYSALVDQADLVVDLRNATGEGARDPTRSGSCDPVAVGRARPLGQEPRRATSTTSPSSRGCATSSPETRERVRARATRTRASTDDFDELLADPRSRRS